MKLKIEKLNVSVEDKQILQDISFEFEKGKTYALTGRNGSGKSSLMQTIMGNPRYQVNEGKIYFDETDISDLAVNERAKLGIFLAFQYPIEIPGVNFGEFLRLAYNSKFSDAKLSIFHFRKLVKEKMDLLGIDHKFLDRNLNEGFSGGEKKRMEILQMLILSPSFVMLDETDSGLDVDGFNNIFENLKILRKQNSDITLVIISHYRNVFEIIAPDKVIVMEAGKIKTTGGKEILEKIYTEGYE